MNLPVWGTTWAAHPNINFVGLDENYFSTGQSWTNSKRVQNLCSSGLPLLPYVHHGYCTKQLYNRLKWSCQEMTFSAVNINSILETISVACVSKLGTPTKSPYKSSALKGKKWFWGSQILKHNSHSHGLLPHKIRVPRRTTTLNPTLYSQIETSRSQNAVKINPFTSTKNGLRSDLRNHRFYIPMIQVGQPPKLKLEPADNWGSNPAPGDVSKPVNDGINYQTQLVFLNHQLYFVHFFINLPAFKKFPGELPTSPHSWNLL